MSSLEEMQRAYREAAEQRRATLLTRHVPEMRSIANALLTLGTDELNDIAYNVGLPEVEGEERDALVQRLVPAVLMFALSWFISMFDEQYRAMQHIVEHDGLATDFREDEMRLDYFQSIGIVFGGELDGKIAWYMPDEIRDEFRRIDNATFGKAIEWNTDIMRLATGILFYYGVLDYDELFKRVHFYMEEEDPLFKFVDFMKVMYNGACWQQNVIAEEKVMRHYAVMSSAEVLRAQGEAHCEFAKLTYKQVYEAGEDNHIEATPQYKSLAQHLMAAYKVDVLRAADIVGKVTIILQNGGTLDDARKFVGKLREVVAAGDTDMAKATALEPLLTAFRDNLRMWRLKGHAPAELAGGKLDAQEHNVVSLDEHRKSKVGRNDPCPCGSGKKYKNCCWRKDHGED